MSCKARRQNDQMVCYKCQLQWDIKDPEPPECPMMKPVGDFLNGLVVDLNTAMKAASNR